jgi:CubicO group peptidase (beta-lactamase class C family)
VLLTHLPLPATVNAQQGSPAADQTQLDQFEQSLDYLRQQYGIPGMSAAIVSHGQLIWEGGFGFSDVENRIPATPDTPYRSASITKTFASMLLMRCVERGTLNLDTRINSYTSGITDSRVTVRHLFTHTSQSSPPGESYLYSGNRYSFLTPVIDVCAGQSFREALAKTILDRLEMQDSVPGQDMEFPTSATAALFTAETLQRYTRVIQRLAKPYVVDGSGRPILSVYPPTGISAAAGLISTVRDLARYDSAIDEHFLLSSQTQEQAWTNHVNSKGQKLPYALGWFVQMYGGERLIWHYGQWDTFSGLFLKVPGRNLTLILLANSSGLSAPFNALGAGNVTGSPFANLFLQMLNDPDAFRGNPIDLNTFFIRQHYLDFLNREPDPDGWAYWTNELTKCAGAAACLNDRRIGVSASFFVEQEFQDTGSFVYRMYKASYGRQPRYQEFTTDRRKVIGGSALETAKEAFAESWIQRPAFLQEYPADMSHVIFVNQLFDTAGLTGYATDREQQIRAMSDGGRSRAQVLRNVIEIQDFKTREYNPSFVLMQYFGYLKRDPEPEGYNFWLNVLNNDAPNNYRGMVCAFITSAEYQDRFGISHAHSNADCGQ